MNLTWENKMMDQFDLFYFPSNLSSIWKCRNKAEVVYNLGDILVNVNFDQNLNNNSILVM